MPATMPAKGGAPEATAIPKHNGNATRNTTVPAVRSRHMVAIAVGLEAAIAVDMIAEVPDKTLNRSTHQIRGAGLDCQREVL